MVHWLLFSCTWFETPLEVHGVEPSRAQSGERVAVHGAGFDGPLSVELANGEPLETVQIRSTDSLELEVPRLPAGSHDLIVRRGDQRGRISLEVLPPPPEEPCARGYQANTELSLQRGEAVVVRFHPDGRTERETVAIEDVEAVVYSTPGGEDGTACSAIHLLRTDGREVLFEDGTSSLEARARTLGDFLRRPVRGLPEPVQR